MRISELNLHEINKVIDIASRVKESALKDNPFSIAKQYGIECRLVRRKEPISYSFKDTITDQGVIHISRRASVSASYLLCYHELGHVLRDDFMDDPIGEFFSNLFLAFFLPDSINLNMINNMTVDEFNNYIYSLIYKKNDTGVLYHQIHHIKKNHGRVYYTHIKKNTIIPFSVQHFISYNYISS